MRNSLYRLASLLGWVNAIAKGNIVKRVFRVFAYRKFSGFIGKFK